MPKKKIGQSDIIGQQGINIIEQVVLEMGFLWYPTGGVEAGIDGIIEIRDVLTGEVTNCILQVQSKATQKTPLQAENENSFEYRFEERDIDYWLQGNAPVIVIVVKTLTKEAFWVSVKDYFNDAKRRQSKKVIFDKRFNRFDVNARDELIKLAVPKNSGLYLAPKPKVEKLYSNLLKVSQISEHLYTAYTLTEDESKAYSVLQKIGRTSGQEWLLKENFVLSFHNLRQAPWTEICDLGTVEQHGVEEWSLSNRLERQQEFVWLLNNALREKVKKDLSYDQKKKCYYFKPTNDLSVRRYHYHSLSKKTHRDVFLAYCKKNSEQVAYYRHSAFEGQFIRIGSDWFLEITPTYFFTRDGYTRDKFEQNHLSGIKRIEKNPAVFGQLIMWAEYLITPAQGDLFLQSYPFLQFFETLEKFEIEVGIDDEIWLRNEDDETTALLKESLNDLPLFQINNED
ncbi:DUF4365 domain-containing protein [Nostoc sp. FACHB-190]|uniref:DUF4365 domain-containing protein n=1 Tax=Nostoc sp. FACHB-190 TaxID=2692838 RepID=UPI001683F954|nr:DUF4365 domain-containing protein [Nostoc sp. FACHB-190]MBD2302215.1 DUF4365 domain-containing protein [Nostoc sp. FACHB-190]